MERKTLYPYAQPKTFEFLKAAMAEKAHMIVPDKSKFRSGADPETEWVRTRNIAGIYLTSPAVLEEVGEMYGYKAKREGPRQAVKKFVRCVWYNSSDLTKEMFPYEEIYLRKPITKRSKYKFSRLRGGQLERVDKLLADGKSLKEVTEIMGTKPRIVYAQAKSLGREPDTFTSLMRNKILLAGLNNLPDNLEDRQNLINLVARRFLEQHSEYFIRLRPLLLEAGVGWRYGKPLDEYADKLKDAGVAVRVICEVRNSKKYRHLFMFKADVQRHLQEIYEKLSLNSS